LLAVNSAKDNNIIIDLWGKWKTGSQRQRQGSRWLKGWAKRGKRGSKSRVAIGKIEAGLHINLTPGNSKNVTLCWILWFCD